MDFLYCLSFFMQCCILPASDVIYSDLVVLEFAQTAVNTVSDLIHAIRIDSANQLFWSLSEDLHVRFLNLEHLPQVLTSNVKNSGFSSIQVWLPNLNPSSLMGPTSETPSYQERRKFPILHLKFLSIINRRTNCKISRSCTISHGKLWFALLLPSNGCSFLSLCLRHLPISY